MGKTSAVLDVLPSVLGASDEGKLLVQVIRALAHPLEAADGELYRIQQAHRLPVAPHPRDILNLAGALDLDAFHFQDLLDAPLDHEQRLEMLRERVRSVAALHLDGLGTPYAVVAAAAIFLGAEVVADAAGDPLLRALDPDGYSHRATIEFPHATGRPRETIVLHENPFRRLKVEPAPRWPWDGWTTENSNPDAGPVRIAIRGVGERTVMPTVFSPDVPGGIVFEGVIGDGETLVIDEQDGALLGERDVDELVTVYRGGMYDDAGADRVAYAVEEPAPPRRRLPRPPLGRAAWRFDVAGGVYEASDFDLAVFDPPEAPVGTYDEDPPLDHAVYDIAPSAIVGMAWDERIACSFKLLLPAHVPALADGAEVPDHAARVAAVLPRFRAAGVTTFVDTAADGWVLGRSVLRGADASDGEGVDFHSVRVLDPSSEELVPFDPAAATAT